MEKETYRKIKELQIGHVKRYKNQFLQFGNNTGIGTYFTYELHGLVKEMHNFCWRRLGVCCLIHD